MKTHSCGCVTGPDPASGVTRSYGKCSHHVQFLADQPQGEDYYKTLGIFDENGAIQSAKYVAELESVIGPLPTCPQQFASRRVTEALEIGGGVSPYVAAVQAAGYQYLGVEPDRWAAEKTAHVYGVEVRCEPYSAQSFYPESFDLILAAHCLEHMPDAPGAVADMYRHLLPGGHLVLVVPDDSDKTNPDHLWFFNDRTLCSVLVRAGFEVVRLGVRRGNDRENFIYCVARKPDAAH